MKKSKVDAERAERRERLDLFAAAALIGLLSRSGVEFHEGFSCKIPGYEGISHDAFSLAKEMLETSEQGGSP